MRALILCLLLCGCVTTGTIPLGEEAPPLWGHVELCKRQPNNELCPK